MRKPAEGECVNSEMRHMAAGCALMLAAIFLAAVVPTELAVGQAGSNASTKFTVLHSFTGGKDGGQPYAGLVSDAAGNLYGTTEFGGDLSCNPPYGCGTVFKVNKAGHETVLHSFKWGTDGAVPAGDLLLASDGTLYGTTADGGGSSNCKNGCGTVFKVDTTGKETVLYKFAATDGSFPNGSLAQDKDGNLYGTTMYGGGNDGNGAGVAFKLDKTGKETTLHAFGKGTDIDDPTGDVVLDAQGNLYGTAWGGSVGSGGVWKVNKVGKETVLYLFTGGTDGGLPMGGVVLGKNGDLYGTAEIGGANNVGVVFQLNKAGTETVVYSFGAWPDDGTYPIAAPVLDNAGNLYGTTRSGGYADAGIAYKIDKTGEETVPHNFEAANDGGLLYGRVILDSRGNLYGVTAAYGKYGQGVVFRISRIGER
jgi:uncharacterized repeat protein (TIGR03803 family)